jgi:20S proteasome alpha/beta subunit
MLYEKRFGPFFVEPVVAGLDADGTPFISAMDLIGESTFSTRFAHVFFLYCIVVNARNSSAQ